VGRTDCTSKTLARGNKETKGASNHPQNGNGVVGRSWGGLNISLNHLIASAMGPQKEARGLRKERSRLICSKVQHQKKKKKKKNKQKRKVNKWCATWGATGKHPRRWDGKKKNDSRHGGGGGKSDATQSRSNNTKRKELLISRLQEKTKQKSRARVAQSTKTSEKPASRGSRISSARNAKPRGWEKVDKKPVSSKGDPSERDGAGGWNTRQERAEWE